MEKKLIKEDSWAKLIVSQIVLFLSGIGSDNHPTRSLCCLPIRNREKAVIGVIQLLNKEEGVFTLDGLFHTQETDRYTSKKPYALNAGGKGLDLLRTRLAFSVPEGEIESPAKASESVGAL